MNNFCPNCGNPIGCSCSGGSSLVKAGDGHQVCTKCKDNYETQKALQIGTKHPPVKSN